jgi:hypothetical protein
LIFARSYGNIFAEPKNRPPALCSSGVGENINVGQTKRARRKMANGDQGGPRDGLSPLLDRGRTIAKPGFNIHRIQSAYEAVAGLSGTAKQMRVSAIMWGKA